MQLGIPATTVQRRRRMLEEEFLTVTYSIDLEKFGWRKVDFLLATERGKTTQVAGHLLKRDEVVYVGRSIGQQTIDLKVETVVKATRRFYNCRRFQGDGRRQGCHLDRDRRSNRKKTSIPFRIIDEL